jgi:hypothetical protein
VAEIVPDLATILVPSTIAPAAVALASGSAVESIVCMVVLHVEGPGLSQPSPDPTP